MNAIKNNLSLILLIIFITLTVITGYTYFYNDYNAKIGNVLGGAFIGLLIATIQFVITIDERRKLDKIKGLKVKNVLFNRAEEGYYRALIKASKINISIMGVTAIRFLQDFASANSTSSEKRVILEALNREVQIKILLPDKNNLSEQEDLENFEKAYELMKHLRQVYSKNFNFRYFNHAPAHSIFNIDDETIVGPVIPALNSRDTPAIHVLNSSKYAKVYLDYFNKEWENAKEL
jgi:hypothetical protein